MVSMRFSVEAAKSNRSTCKGCGLKIDKGEVRIGCELEDLDGEFGGHAITQWRHVHCVQPSWVKLDELDGLGPIEPPTREPEDPPSAAAEDPSGGGTSAIAVMEAQYLQLLQQMQYRDLTPEDLQLLKSIEKERAERHSKSPAMRVNSARQLGSWPCSSAGPSSSAA
jgi:hypothetical protein